MSSAASASAITSVLPIEQGNGYDVDLDAVQPLPEHRAFRWTSGRTALLAVVLLYLGVILVAPLFALAREGWIAGVPRLTRELVRPEALFALRQSLVLATIAVVVNGVFGLAAAIVLVRHRFVGRRFLDALVDLTLAISPVMTGLAFLLVFGRAGWFAPVLEVLGLRVVFAFPGLVMATLFVTLPFTVREVSYVLEEVGTDEEQVASTLGASPWQTLWRVTIPNVRHGLMLGLTLTAARALGEFGAVLVLGGAISGQTQTATTFIYSSSEERQDAAAFGMAILLATSSMCFLVALQYLKRRRTLS